MIEVHFSGLTSQSNIYGLTTLTTSDGLNKVLIASQKRKVYCIEYTKNEATVIPSTREVQFTYIPGGAEIISIDAFKKSTETHDFLVGITFVKLGEQADPKLPIPAFFNIYSEWQPVTECNLDNIAQGCFSLNLSFTPYQLTHVEAFKGGNREIVWLLSGGDRKVHMYKEDKSHQCFCEETPTLFPEFDDLKGIIQWMDFMHLNNRRITAYGTHEGLINVSVVILNSDCPDVESSCSIRLDSPISAVQLFTDTSSINVPSFLKWEDNFKADKTMPNINLIVGSTLERSVVYKNIMKKKDEMNLEHMYILLHSHSYDCVTTVYVADIDMDGFNEILIGTYGQELLCYKWINSDYVFQWNRSFPYPILSIAYVDIIGDGIKEILILSTKGMHILQHNLQKAMQLCIKRMQSLLQKRK